MADIFVSYAHSDAMRARSIAAILGGKGWSVWWDPEIQAGDSFVSVINTEIALARCVVVLWSQTSVTSRWVMEEAHYGLTKGILCPVLIDRGPQLPVGFATVKYIDVTEWNGEMPAGRLDLLFAQVERLIGPAKPAPVPIRVTPAVVDERVESTPQEPAAASPSPISSETFATAPKPVTPPPAASTLRRGSEIRQPSPSRSRIAARQGFIDFSDVSWIDFPVVALLWVATTLIMAEAFMRYVLQMPSGFFELSSLMLSSAAFLGGAIAIRNGREIRGPIAILFQRYTGRFQGSLNALVTSALFALMTWQLFKLAMDSYNSKEQTIGLPPLPLWPWKALVVLAFGAIAFASLATLIRRLSRGPAK